MPIESNESHPPLSVTMFKALPSERLSMGQLVFLLVAAAHGQLREKRRQRDSMSIDAGSWPSQPLNKLCATSYA
jgi:hypothetical protein